TFDPNPAAIEFGRTNQALGRAPDRFMARGVIELDDLAAFDDRMRDQNILSETARNPLRNRRLAVAGRAIDEHPLAGVDRRAKLSEHRRLDMDVGKCFG